MNQASFVIKNLFSFPSGMVNKTTFDKAHALPNNRTSATGRNSKLRTIMDMVCIGWRMFMYNPFAGYCQEVV